MTSEQQQVKEWMQRFGQETPEKPIIPSLEVRKLRAKLILEEALETIHALGLAPFNSWLKHLEYSSNVKHLDFREINNPNLVAIADGCEDLKVVTEGTLIACGLVMKDDDLFPFRFDPLFMEVMNSNNSKMWTGDEIVLKGFNTKPEHKIVCTKLHKPGEICDYGHNEKCLLVTDKDGKVIKSPSYSPPNLEPLIKELEKT